VFFGYAPCSPSPVSVWGFKSNGIENAGYLTVGPSLNYASQSHSKNNQINQLFGDLGYIGVAWGTVYDPDWIDHPIWDWGT
jgi:hypothetical protein